MRRFKTLAAILTAAILCCACSTVQPVSQIQIDKHTQTMQQHKPANDIQTTKPTKQTEVQETSSFNTEITTYLLAGIDKLGDDAQSTGQADAIALLCVDKKNKKLDVMPIDRNTMMMVNAQDENGEDTEAIPLQICLQHAYAKNRTEAAQRLTEAVSSFMYDIPIQGYATVDMEGVVKIIDILGGITFVPNENIPQSSYGEAITAGTEVTMTGKQALYYARYRDINEFGSSAKRTARQKEVLSALAAKIKEAKAADTMDITQMLTAVYPYVTTNLGIADIKNLAETAGQYQNNVEIYELQGETIIGETGHEEFNADENALYNTIYDIYY